MSETISTLSMSPGAAPRTATGRFRQCPRKSPVNIFGLPTSPGNSCRSRYPAASSDRTTIVSPDSTVTAGACAAEKTFTVSCGVGSTRYKAIADHSPGTARAASGARPGGRAAARWVG